MKCFQLVVAALVLSILGSCAPTPKLPQYSQDELFYNELEIPDFPFNFIYLNFVRNFDDGTADGNFALYRADADVVELSNFFSRQVGGQFELTFEVAPDFDPDDPFSDDRVTATLLVGVQPESLDGVLLVPELEIESEVSLTGPVSGDDLTEVLDAYE